MGGLKNRKGRDKSENTDGDSSQNKEGDKSKWDDLLRRAGYSREHSPEHNSHGDSYFGNAYSKLKHSHWIHQNPDKQVSLATMKDHLYDFIDAPGRDSGKQGLFGIAKNFPETTRSGYRDYLEEKLRKKAEERDDSPDASTVGSSSDGKKHKSHHGPRHIFKSTDFSLTYKIRRVFHAEFAEFLGVFTMLAIGLSSSVQAKLGGQAYSNYTTTVMSWGIANMLGIYVAGGYSGAHLNPVVTLTLWIYRGFPFKRLFTFWLAQFVGALAATAWVFILYYPALQERDPHGWSMETGTMFFVTPDRNVPLATAWFNEVTATGIMHLVIFAVGDSHNVSPARGMNALVLGFAVTAIGSSFGFLTPFGMNPVRDFAPRVFLSMVGFPKKMWTQDKWFWVVGEITGPITGGMVGAGAYDLFVFDGPESPINFPRQVKIHTMQMWFRRLLHPFRREKHELDVEQEPMEEVPEEVPESGIEGDDGTVQNVGQPAQ